MKRITEGIAGAIREGAGDLNDWNLSDMVKRDPDRTPNDRVFVLTGAGVSAESGLPTFRGAGGLWRGYRVEDVASPVAWARDPLMVWQFYSMRRKAHTRKAAELRRTSPWRNWRPALGDRLFLCTQNVDRLHEEAGSRRVVHMHGRLFQSRCDSCARPPFEDANTYEDSRCRDARAADRFGRTSAGSARRRTRWTPSSGNCGAVRCSWRWERRAWSIRRRHSRHRHAATRNARTYYVGPEEPANRAMFDECFLGPAGELLPRLFHWSQLGAVSV